jgi:class 3 adenylate cyclase/tetratricopeptide (TPR) repeat protein
VTIGAHRKVVTVLFCDVVGSTSLGESVDPEALHGLLAHYFERMKAIVESHGGSVEKFIGDAVMAVFGVPVAHEDDALRACRAAVDMRDALPELGVEGRIGVDTGEVLTGTEERLATGDAVNVAARLEQAAEPGEVLIGAETLALVGATVEVGEQRLLELKGKSVPVVAQLLVAVRDAPERSHTARFVGRERELEQLVEAWDRALVGVRCELVTIVGDPGVGKSRMVAEALKLIDARVVRGRCLAYGEGITYWPVIEVLKQLTALPSGETAADAIRSLLGESDAWAGTDEIAWAFRKLLEEQAPLVVCFDDIQWGEETFLDLVESTALLSTGAPLLLVCMARPELIDRRPSWPATLRLEPLQEEDAGALVGDAVPDEVRQLIVRTAGGNPLFLTEMVALSNEGAGDVEVPPTLRALLAMRLDQLDGAERNVLERGSVEGEIFHRGAVQALAPEETQVTARLAALVRRQLVRPDRAQLVGDDGYRFRHLLIRDAAYDALPKSVRADLHARFAYWLDEFGRELVEREEIVGYHLEQANRYLVELGQENPTLAVAAGERLTAAGRRAFWRSDHRAAAGLLMRGLVLLRPHTLDVHAEIELAHATFWADWSQALEIAEAAAARAEALGDEAGAAAALTVVAEMRVHGGEGSVAELERRGRDALPLLEAAEDHDGLFAVWDSLATVASMRSRYEDWTRAQEQSVWHARRAGHRGAPVFPIAIPLMTGPRPASEALATLDALVAETPDSKALVFRAVLLAMLDRIDEAWALAVPAEERARELGFAAGPRGRLADIASLAGDHDKAADYERLGCEALEASGRTSELSTALPKLGRFLCNLGRYDEAEQLAQRGRELGDVEDIATQQLWRQTQALVHSARGVHPAAEDLAREAVDFSLRSDSPWHQGDAFYDLGRVLEAAGRIDDATAAYREALDRYELKEIIPLARRVRARLTDFQETPG